MPDASALEGGKPPPAQGRDGRFLPGNSGGGGRPAGARNKLSEAFLTALARDFDQHGAEVIAHVRENEPAAYVRVIAGVLPRKFEMESGDMSQMSDAQLEAIIAADSDTKGRP